MENALASQWLMRIGILLLFAGAAYLMKYSIDNNLTPVQRVYAGLISGLALVIASHKIKEGPFTLLRYGLMGVGVGILYIANLAATALYQLIPDPRLCRHRCGRHTGRIPLSPSIVVLGTRGNIGGLHHSLVIGIQGQRDQ